MVIPSQHCCCQRQKLSVRADRGRPGRSDPLGKGCRWPHVRLSQGWSRCRFLGFSGRCIFSALTANWEGLGTIRSDNSGQRAGMTKKKNTEKHQIRTSLRQGPPTHTLSPAWDPPPGAGTSPGRSERIYQKNLRRFAPKPQLGLRPGTPLPGRGPASDQPTHPTPPRGDFEVKKKPVKAAKMTKPFGKKKTEHLVTGLKWLNACGA